MGDTTQPGRSCPAFPAMVRKQCPVSLFPNIITLILPPIQINWGILFFLLPSETVRETEKSLQEFPKRFYDVSVGREKNGWAGFR